MSSRIRPQSAVLRRSTEVQQYFSHLKPPPPDYQLKLYPSSHPKPPPKSPHPTESLRLQVLALKSRIQREKEAIDRLKVVEVKAKKRLKGGERTEKVKLEEEIGVLQMRVRKAKKAKAMVKGEGEGRVSVGEALCEECMKLRERQRHLETHPTVQTIRHEIAQVRGQINRCKESIDQESSEIIKLKTQLASVPALASLGKQRKEAKKELKRLEKELQRQVDVGKMLGTSWLGPEVIPEAPVVYGDTTDEISTALHTLQAWDSAPALILQHIASAEAANLSISVPLT